MIDLHTHTFLSDGELCPAEHVRYAEVAGYKILGFADHVDLATIPVTLPVLIDAAKRESELGKMKVLPGVELTHVRPEHIKEATELARALGAAIVIVHGETIAEKVIEGTNRAAIEAEVDILAHPGLITDDEVQLAVKNNVRLEISGKAGHSLCNGYVAAKAKEFGAQLIFGSDSHSHSQMITKEQALRILRGAAITVKDAEQMFVAAEEFALSRFESI